jgi:hypothetical protein
LKSSNDYSTEMYKMFMDFPFQPQEALHNFVFFG